MTLEAFGVVLYVNNYKSWLRTSWGEGENSGESSDACDIPGVTSSIKGSSIGIFINAASGCGKYNGWL